ncbi:VTT domain-containing protein [Oceanirhabdus sp. W0125-5]|uniref:VTT domain-containing protein n=1 Tax=Oceanirhabdus sp. W0125-5 TaxID=2999116 RepID=UPI0022F2C52B|nr:VTT domain-containing protein [Oceanirhabdus sp. W0125-5]WBW96472.1 VTT domain-containing protein [Oceanirhabdus sp. W0125-5]
MKKSNNIKVYIILLWLIIVLILFRNNLITTDYTIIIKFLNTHEDYISLFFILLSTFRILIFVPGSIFMVLGGIIFPPLKAFTLSMISMIISQSIIFFIAKTFSNTSIKNYFLNKYPNLNKLIIKNNYKFLSLGILCPVAPTDAVSFLVSYTKPNYLKYISVIILSNIPMMLLYSLIGESFKSSFYYLIIVVSLILIILFYTKKEWSRITNASPPKELL